MLRRAKYRLEVLAGVVVAAGDHHHLERHFYV
jgi:hypothetical protein